jgi:molybdenum cofactor guanylyltransferase
MKLLGAILAGGHSRRFGSDKAEALLEGRTLLAHVADALQAHCDAVILCGRTDREMDFLDDRPRPGLGPLGGLCAALAHGKAAGFTAVFSAPCDVPGLPPSLLARLLDAAGPAYVADLPVVGIWPCWLAGQLHSWLDNNGDRSFRAWARAVSAVPVKFAPRLANINTPDDLTAFGQRHACLS